MASLTGAMNGSPPELGPMARVISEAEAFRQMSPIDRLKLNMPSNWATVGDEQASQNQQQNLRDLLSIVPGPGNVIAAEDASTQAGEATNAFGEGRYGRAALHGGLSALSAFGAVTGLPTGRMAGNAARGASSRTNIFAGPMAKTADQAALAKAQEMAAAGVGRDAIHAQTGWHQGVDGKWRFEIDDSGAKIADPAYIGGGITQFSTVDHPQLSAAYGDVPNVYGHIELGKRPSGSYLAARGDTPAYLEAQGSDAESALSIALHELQHDVQGREGLSRGATVNNAPGFYDLKSEWIAKNPGKQLSAGDLYGLQEEAYRRAAGEVEARNAQTRMNMTAAERRAKAPWLTQDVPDEQQIVRKR